MRRGRSIEKRTRYFLGCEGESEQAYGSFLNRLASEAGLKIHIVAVNLQPAGDSLALAEKAVRACKKEEDRGAIAAKSIMLDRDKFDELPEKGRRAQALMNKEGFASIWQRPDHEGFLLRHFPGQEHANPPRGYSMTALTAHWPGYRKNMAAADLRRVLTFEHVARASGVIPELHRFLKEIGLL